MNWKKYLSVTFAGILMMVAFICTRDLTASAAQKAEASRWTGSWEAVAGEIMTVKEKDGFLDILGKDSASIYSSTGIIEGNEALCYGSGMNHENNQRFIYRSQLKLSANGQELQEIWEIGFATGKEIKWLKSTANFKRKKAASK